MEKPRLVEMDPWLEPYLGKINYRIEKYDKTKRKLLNSNQKIKDFALGYLFYGLHKTENGWVFREWAPNATKIYLVGEFNNWQETDEYILKKIDDENWEIKLQHTQLSHKDKYRLKVYWNNGNAERLPSYVKRIIQDENTKGFDAQVWAPTQLYEWKNESPISNIKSPLIYEAHVGMATENESVGTYTEFKERILPRIKKAGYNTVQLMAILEHPYYGSFGYHVTNFYAPSSRFGTPEELKELIDEAHGMGIAVIMDIVHSHSARNEAEGLAHFDGTPYQYFHEGERREHVAWDSLCFNYSKPQVLHFLLSNVQYWMQEFKFDGFRFDGVTSMIYLDHGLSRDFTHYNFYFDEGEDEDAITYLKLANNLIHEINPKAISIAEEMSGMPGLATPTLWGGLGFDYRMAMGIPDFWIKIIKERTDNEWDMGELFHELTSRRVEEKTIGYAESHDQALVGDKTIIFRLIDKDMYWHMNTGSENLIIERGIALHKMIRLITASTAGGGYLNFMGNEFGHPEWIDFPREGNNWSFKHARRQWSLVDNPNLRYQHLNNFDNELIHLLKTENLLSEMYIEKIHDDNNDKVLVYKRGNFLFAFNFHPTNSYSDYGIHTPGGKYNVVLHTDKTEFGGFSRIDDSITYFTQRTGKISSPFYLKIYLPSRTGIVFKFVPTASVRDRRG